MPLHRLGHPRRLASFAAVSLLLAVVATAFTDPMTTMNPKSSNADSVQGVYVIVLWLTGIVFVGVLALTLILAIMFRERPGREARQFHGNTRLEVWWSLIPVVIVAIIAVPTFISIFETSADPPEDAVVVEVTGHQWWFEFRYPDQGIVTANEIHVPVDRAASFKLQSDDVIHSFWVPQLAGKVDMVPGHENDLWFTPNEVGMYLGQCAEFCGLSHANMRFRVFVDTPAEFEAWVASQKADRVAPSTDELTEGEQLFLTGACVGCHTIQGTAAQGIVGPNLTHVGGRSTIAAGIIDITGANAQENLARWISNPDREKPGAGMPAFEDLLTPVQIASISDYLLSLQ